MRWRPTIWLLVSMLFLAAAVWWGIPQKPAPALSQQAPAPERHTLARQTPAVARDVGHLPTHWPRAELRLSNTDQPRAQLTRSDKAILLENALIATDRAVDLPIPDSLRATGDPGSYLVQARGAPDDGFRSLLRNAGAEIVSYIPNNAYLVRASAEVARNLAQNPSLQAVLPFEPYFKISPALLPLAVQSAQPGSLAAPANPALPGSQQPMAPLNVVLFGNDRETTLAALRQLPIRIVSEQPSPFGPAFAMLARPADIAALARLAGVQAIEPAVPRQTANDLARARLAVAADSEVQQNYLGLTGTNVVVAVNDTGVDATHPDLSGRVWFDQLASGVDTNGHGTHVAGIIAGCGTKSRTVTNAPGSQLPAERWQFRGLAPRAQLFSTALDLSRSFTQTDAELQQSAARTNALISNNSWTYGGPGGYDLGAASYDAATRDTLPATSGAQPVLFVFAAGNCGDGSDDGTGGKPDTISSPGTAKNVITVGAIEQFRTITNDVWRCAPSPGPGDPVVCTTNQPWLPSTDSSNQVASFSSRGPVGPGVEGEIGRFKPDVVAPGTFLLSTRSGQWDAAAYYQPTNSLPGSSNYFEVLSNLNDRLGPYYRFESGTSLAGAAVAGTLALMEEFFQQRLGHTPSPALLKAVLINGARTLGVGYDFHPAGTNAQGWGLVNLPASIPAAMTNGVAPGPLLYFDQEITNALATGESFTRFVTVTNTANDKPLRMTLVWTDPPGNPLAGIKLVNNLDLVVTNLDSGQVCFGNDIAAGQIFNQPWNPALAPNLDIVNNVENVYLAPPLGTSYSVTVIGRRVPVNAVTAQSSKVAQDYALVVSSGDGQITNALRLVSSAAKDEPAPFVATLPNTFTNVAGAAGTILSRERVGACAAPSSTNVVLLPPDFTTQLTLGATNQWRFYVLTNETTFTNAAFVTFHARTLALPRPGTDQTNVAQATRTQADIDLYVSQNPALTNLDPAAIAAADKSIGRDGTEMVLYTNATPGTFYIGVKSESQTAAEFDFAALLSESPFFLTDDLGNQVLRGVPAPQAIPAGTPTIPGEAIVLCLAGQPMPVHRVVVTNTITHPAMNDLTAALEHGDAAVTLSRYSTNGAVTNLTFVFDDSRELDIPGAQPSDGPGRLTDFAGQQAWGPWPLSVSSTNSPGTNESLWVFLETQVDIFQGFTNTVLAGGCSEELFDLPASATSLSIDAILLGGTGPVSIEVLPLPEQAGQATSNIVAEASPETLVYLDLYSHPPVGGGKWAARVCNLGPDPASVRLQATAPLATNWPSVFRFISTQPLPLADDALTSSTLNVTNAGWVDSVEVGVRIDHPRVSDLALYLVSPGGRRVLLSENRGGASTNGFGDDITVTNIVPATSSGGWQAVTNQIEVGHNSGSVSIIYDFYTFPDRMQVYYETNLLFDSGLVSNTGGTNFNFGPGTETWLTVVMNAGGSQDTNTAWYYRITTTHPDVRYAFFTEDTNRTSTPIKFAAPPFKAATPPPEGQFAALPEESLAKLKGDSAFGAWKLEAWDTAADATNPAPALLAWQLALTLRNQVPLPIPLSHAGPLTNTLPGGQLQWLAIDVPAWAGFATNRLLAASAPVRVWFNQSAPPTGTNAGDVLLLAGVVSGQTILYAWSTPPLVQGAPYYLGVENTNPAPVSFTFETEFNVTPLAFGVPLTNVLGSQPRYFACDVSSNATSVSFQLLGLSGDANLVANPGLPFPTPASFAYGSFNPGTLDESIIVFTNSVPYALTPGLWYVGVFNAADTNVTFTILATEYTNPVPVILDLVSGVPSPGLVQPGAIDYYRFVVGTNAARVQFELRQLATNLDLVVRKGLPLPTPASYGLLSANPGTNDELLVLYGTSSPISLTPGEWFLGAVNATSDPADYMIVATEYDGPLAPLAVTDVTLGFDSLCLTWTSVPGGYYHVVGATNVNSTVWSAVSPTITGSGGVTTWCLPLPLPEHFFRVKEGSAPAGN